MIRFSASLVVVGVGLLIAGGITSKLVLIYIAIGISALALLFLILGAILHRAELFGREPEGIGASQASHEGYADEVDAKPAPAAAAVAASPAPEPLAARGSTESDQAAQAFAGYEQFTRQAARRPEPARGDRPSRPSRPPTPPPFVDPHPTRMDWAADLRQAEKQERDRQSQPQRPERPQPSKPFVDPQPTRMDWAGGLREAEKQELGRQPERPSRPPSTPEPAPAQATRAERIQQPAEAAQATRAERIQQPAEAAQATRAEKIITAKPDDKPDNEAAGKEQPAEADEAAAETAAKVQDKPAPEQPAATPSAPETEDAAEAVEDSQPAVDESDPAQPDEDEAGAAAPETKTSDAGRETGGVGDAVDDQDVTVVPGVPRYHRSECILIRFMGDGDLQRMPVEQARKAGCTPCRACQPDGEEDD